MFFIDLWILATPLLIFLVTASRAVPSKIIVEELIESKLISEVSKNFSTFKKRKLKGQLKKLQEIAKLIEKREMPLESYTYIHKDAILNEAQIKLIRNWTKKSYDKLMADSLAKSDK